MPHAIRIHQPGGPEAMVYDEVAVGAPGAGQARVRHTAIGVNYIDTYHRSGLYPLPLPAGIGSEAAGVVEAVGEGVDWVKPGDRVAYCVGAPGAYSTERVREITRGEMVPVVYDSVGKDTFQASRDCLQPFGLMVSFGNASGPVPPMALSALKGSLYVTRPTLMAHTARRSNLDEMSADLIRMVSSGKVKIPIDQRYPLAEAAQAHRDLEARRTTGSTVLVP